MPLRAIFDQLTFAPRVVQCGRLAPSAAIRVHGKPWRPQFPPAIHHATAGVNPSRQIRSYASFSHSISVNLDAASRSMAEPQILAGCRNVQLALTDKDWPKWDPDAKPHDPRCHSKLSHIIGALDSSPNIDFVFLALSDILELPLVHQSLPIKQERTPATIFSTIAVHVEPVDLGFWNLPDYPSIFIRDVDTMRMLQQARTYKGDAVAWQRVIANAGPVYHAYDYTASFHAIDLAIRSDIPSASMRTVDFGPYGSESCATSDLDSLSTCFADDLAHNIGHFKLGNPWFPNLYDHIKKESGGAVSSKLGYKPKDTA